MKRMHSLRSFPVKYQVTVLFDPTCRWHVECSDSTDKIQIGSPFYVTVTGRCSLGGFWNFRLINITIRATGAGVSEHYWK